MELVTYLIDIVLHLDHHLNTIAAQMGPWLYLLLFLIVFCETGLVVTPFLPGDSLLFAVGALAATSGSTLSLPLLLVLLIVAAIAGDAVNYSAGYFLGPRVFRYENSWLLNKKHLERTQAFYERHGGKTIVLARFMPIVRTFAPFVAGIGRMSYARFAFYNIFGGIVWVTVFLVGGYFLGNIPLIRNNFALVTVAIVIVSVIPLGVEFVLARARKGKHDESKSTSLAA